MEEYRTSSHAVYKCIYHFVWVPKYRYAVLMPKIKERLKKILQELCEWMDAEILEGGVCSEHVHLVLSVPPKHSPSFVMKILKGKSAELLRKEFLDLAKRYWGMHIWARGYFVSTAGINEEQSKRYVQGQEDDTFDERDTKDIYGIAEIVFWVTKYAKRRGLIRN